MSGSAWWVAFLVSALVSPLFVYADSVHVSWVFGDYSSASYRLLSFEPAEANVGPIDGADPTLNVAIGRRYRVRVVNHLSHPFEVIAKASDAAQDIVLLSATPGVNPSWENDPGVRWTDDGVGTVEFTLTFDLYNAMQVSARLPGYRCGLHAFTMRGDFAVSGLPVTNPIPESILPGSVAVELEPVLEGLAAPVHLEEAPDGTGRLFVVDQPGRVWIIQGGQALVEPFMDVSARLVSPLGVLGSHDENDFDERGLLGLALHPQFGNPEHPGLGKVYTYTSEPVNGPADFTTPPLGPNQSYNHQSVIAEWTVDESHPNRVNPDSRRELLRIDQPQFNHNAGMLAFGPDGYLYIGLGDGGGANDTAAGHGEIGNGQNLETVHGSILRLDPLAPAATPDSTDPVSANGAYRVPATNPFVGVAGIDEIFAYGFRNPYRFSFDPRTDELIVGDVGQNFIEEIDIVQPGGNYGWNLMEGGFRFDPISGLVTDDLALLPADLLGPAAQYDHDEGLSVIGGYVYQGTAIPELAGRYVFGDFSTGFSSPAGRLFEADLQTGVIHELVIGAQPRPLGLYVKGFGRDAAGELYLLADSTLGPYGEGGVVMRIVDVCSERLSTDLNGDCRVDLLDLTMLAADWLRCTHRDVGLCTP